MRRKRRILQRVLLDPEFTLDYEERIENEEPETGEPAQRKSQKQYPLIQLGNFQA